MLNITVFDFTAKLTCLGGVFQQNQFVEKKLQKKKIAVCDIDLVIFFIIMPEDDFEKTKQCMRRRLFAAGKLLDSGKYFLTCTNCKGSGKYCKESLDNGNLAAALMTCPKCQGAGFIELAEK